MKKYEVIGVRRGDPFAGDIEADEASESGGVLTLRRSSFLSIVTVAIYARGSWSSVREVAAEQRQEATASAE
jgi:hypothetical protein